MKTGSTMLAFFVLLGGCDCAKCFTLNDYLGIETGDLENRGDLFPQILREEAVARLYELGKVPTNLNSALQ